MPSGGTRLWVDREAANPCAFCTSAAAGHSLPPSTTRISPLCSSSGPPDRVLDGLESNEQRPARPCRARAAPGNRRLGRFPGRRDRPARLPFFPPSTSSPPSLLALLENLLYFRGPGWPRQLE